MPGLARVSGLLAAVVMVTAAYAAEGAGAPAPATVNHFEGAVSLDGRALAAADAGTVAARPGQSIETGKNGEAEVLLAYGAFLRLGENSEVKFLATGAHDIRFELKSGEAVLDAAKSAQRDRFQAVVGDADEVVEKAGVYGFHMTDAAFLVYQGKAAATANGHRATLHAGDKLRPAGAAAARAQKLDKPDYDALYYWNQTREKEVAAASEWTEDIFDSQSKTARQAAGWHWNPWYGTWAYIPAFTK